MPSGIPTTAVEITGPSKPMFIALANDLGFRARFLGLLEAIVAQVLNTTVGQGTPVVTAGQQTYARSVLAAPQQYLATIILYEVQRTNIASTNIWVDLSSGTPALYCDVTDAAILSQLANDWAQISGA
jgi:hypothetical protein